MATITMDKNYIKDYIKPILDTFHMIPLFCAVFGSYVYGTNTINSDYDVYLICQQDPTYKKNVKVFTGDSNHNYNDKINIDLMIRTLDQFKHSVSIGDPNAIELLLSPDEFIIHTSDIFQDFKKSVDFTDPIVRKAIRTGFSEKSNNSEVKARKKFIDNEIQIALKSQFHSYRILCFGIQIGSKGYIYNWSIANDYLEELISDIPKFSEQYFRDSIKLWLRTKPIDKVLFQLDNDKLNGSITTCFKNLLPK